jgi:hypothetical protein
LPRVTRAGTDGWCKVRLVPTDSELVVALREAATSGWVPSGVCLCVCVCLSVCVSVSTSERNVFSEVKLADAPPASLSAFTALYSHATARSLPERGPQRPRTRKGHQGICPKLTVCVCVSGCCVGSLRAFVYRVYLLLSVGATDVIACRLLWFFLFIGVSRST